MSRRQQRPRQGLGRVVERLFTQVNLVMISIELLVINTS